MKVIIPPLKSQGIKTKLVPPILELVREAASTGRWIEPFMGTGVVGFNAGFPRALMSDANPHLVHFYAGLLNGDITPSSVRSFLEYEGALLAKSGYDHYLHVRERFNRDFAPLDFLFLNRSGFNGMIRFSRKGLWNIPFCKKPDRFQPGYITKIVNQVTRVREVMTGDWSFTNGSFTSTLLSAVAGDLVYCDPPYFGRYADYYNGWTEEDEARLFALLDRTPAKFILSTWSHNAYRHNPMIDAYWSRFRIHRIEHFYYSGGKMENRNAVVEALVVNF
ncbi:DNA adenine methylase [Dinghuibacter silviterrae]|uniref:Site-specific DNA-methyltransferase (adenine-specific) n=1 Tax=Dinghuibacter silviterrae TaxID=1539049 RepID=A0A4R8DNX3_9BACT|nr:Dam family site-specific DNA-(adenine-N6)-methyltransferase [Dinghuibacter silviterrae]TDW99751.1 DNA adenine methylase [Dinghuibacter silviterrae]